MLLTAKLLLFLNPDSVSIIDLAQYVYGDSSIISRYKTQNILSILKRNHWLIQGPGHILSEKHFQVVCENKKIIMNWPRNHRLTPRSVRRAASEQHNICRLNHTSI
jgi:hypothetical protein